MFSNFPMGSYRSRKAAMASAARSAEKPQKPAKESCRGGPMNLMRVLSGGTGGPGGRSSSLVMLIREAGTGLSGRLGYSSAVSIVLFLLTLALMVVNLRLTYRKES